MSLIVSWNRSSRVFAMVFPRRWDDDAARLPVLLRGGESGPPLLSSAVRQRSREGVARQKFGHRPGLDRAPDLPHEPGVEAQVVKRRETRPQRLLRLEEMADVR